MKRRTLFSTLVLRGMRRRRGALLVFWALCLILWPELIQAQFVSQTVLHGFSGAATQDGASPYAGVIPASDGVLYGTTWGGGSKGAGTVYKIGTDGSSYAMLHNFTNTPDGSSPYSNLLEGQDEILYGTTYFGGVSNAGTVFRIRTDGTEYQVLHSFIRSPDAAHPWAGLIQGRDGALYGTTLKGGVNDLGTVFTIKTNGGYAVLHSFVSDFSDGFTPYAGLIQGHDGALYGTTDQGGSTLLGTVFRITTDGSSYQVLHTFVSGLGYWPRGALVQGNDGMLYGTTFSGGPENGGSTVFRLGTNGLDFAMLHAFPGGSGIWGGLLQTSDGALYGTTSWTGNYDGGVVFRLQTDGTDYAVLHHFASSTIAGAHPNAGLTGRNGALYGTTLSGGVRGFGTVFRLTLAPTLEIAQSPKGPRITVRGFSPCRLDATTNCADWFPRANLVLTNGAAEFLETDTAAAPSRLYRAVVQ